MKLIEITLLERYVNLFTPVEKEKYVDEVWELLQKAYEPVGGFKSAVSKEDLIQDSSLWKMVRKNNKIVSVDIYKDKHGKKSIAGGTDGTTEGKRELMKMKSDDLKLQRSWCECSGKVEGLLKKMGAVPIENKFAAKLTGKEILAYDVDGVHYTRLIQGEPIAKAIYGFPKITDEMKAEVEHAHLTLNKPT